MTKLLVFLLGMAGLCGAMSESANHMNLIGLGMFATACILGVKYE